MKRITFFLLIFSCFIQVKGPSLQDTTAHSPDQRTPVSLLKKSIVPLSLIGAEALLSGSNLEKIYKQICGTKSVTRLNSV